MSMVNMVSRRRAGPVDDFEKRRSSTTGNAKAVDHDEWPD
jgi:hypothetical protein